MSFVSPIGTLVKICEGKLAAAILLNQILFQSRFPIKIGHEGWIARSQSYWQVNTGLSKKQIKTAIKYLTSKKMLICYKYRSATMACGHYRINVILSYLCPKLVPKTPEEVYFGKDNNNWSKHVHGQDITHYELLHKGFIESWRTAKEMDCIHSPQGKTEKYVPTEKTGSVGVKISSLNY